MPTIQEILRRDLTPEQFSAAIDGANEILCLACAGSGKSRTLAYRIARIIAGGADPASIVAFTFTDKAADSIKQRVASALLVAGLSPTILGAIYIGTIHSYCQYVLGEMDARYRQFDVLDENRLKLYIISRYPELGLSAIRAARPTAGGNRQGYFETIRRVSDAWKTANDEMLTLQSISAADAQIGGILTRLRGCLDRDQFIDFSLMIRLVVDALQREDAGAERAIAPVKHLMVDEYQDVNPLQEELIRQMHRRIDTLFVVGDDDQAIYSWRGADVQNILTFRTRFPNATQHSLTVNFRSTEPIVRTADAFAAAELGASRYVKNPRAQATRSPNDYRVLWFPARGDEASWVADRIQSLIGTEYIEYNANGSVREGRGLTPADFAVLMRSTRLPEGENGPPRHAAFTRALLQRNITYSLEAGGSIFDRPQVQVLRSAFGLFRSGTPDRQQAQQFFHSTVLPHYPQAEFTQFTTVLTDWGRKIHRVPTGPRLRLYPQGLVHDLLNAFRIDSANFDAGTMQDIGMFSRIMQDVETVYMSIDSRERFEEILNFLENVAEEGYDTETTEVLLRPDAVTVSTVHKMKGLEFPVVFLVDVEAERFPKRRRRYDGWLPASLLQQAIARGAYQSTRNEESRLFYTAVTRAERFLHISGCSNMPGGRKTWGPSTFVGRLIDPAINRDANGVAPGLVAAPQRRRLDETVMPTSYSDIRYYLRCPRDYQLRKSFGFSPPIADLFGFGTTVHAAVCKLHEISTITAPSGATAEQVAQEVFHVKHVPQSRDPQNNPGPYERAKQVAGKIVRKYAEAFASDFERRRQVEVRFEIPVHQAVISGSIDLMLKEDAQGRILDAEVVDFKAMEGGPDPSANEDLQWTELALQVQLYAKAARDVLSENARTGALHLLKDNKRVRVPVDDAAVQAALANVEWAVDRIIHDDFPMRPHPAKCAACDFKALCQKRPQAFQTTTVPPDIHVPGQPNHEAVPAFSEFDSTT